MSSLFSSTGGSRAVLGVTGHPTNQEVINAVTSEQADTLADAVLLQSYGWSFTRPHPKAPEVIFHGAPQEAQRVAASIRLDSWTADNDVNPKNQEDAATRLPIHRARLQALAGGESWDVVEVRLPLPAPWYCAAA
jgi:hypothetical protein